jgi:uncharacterized protein (DUF4415 family)
MGPQANGTADCRQLTDGRHVRLSERQDDKSEQIRRQLTRASRRDEHAKTDSERLDSVVDVDQAILDKFRQPGNDEK